MNGYIVQLNELLQRAQASDDAQRLRIAFKQLKKQLNQQKHQLDDDSAKAKFTEASDQLLAAIDCGLIYMKDDQQPLEPAWIHMESAQEALQEGFLLEQQARELMEQVVYVGAGHS